LIALAPVPVEAVNVEVAPAGAVPENTLQIFSVPAVAAASVNVTTVSPEPSVTVTVCAVRFAVPTIRFDGSTVIADTALPGLSASVTVTFDPAVKGVVAVGPVTRTQLPPVAAVPAGTVNAPVTPLTVNEKFVPTSEAVPAILQIFSRGALLVNVTIVSFETSPAGTVATMHDGEAGAQAAPRFTKPGGGPVAVTEVTNADEPPVSLTVTVPAGTVSGVLHAPTGTVVVVVKPIAPATLNVKLPVTPEPVAASLQISS
jgi:hypothetical protein